MKRRRQITVSLAKDEPPVPNDKTENEDLSSSSVLSAVGWTTATSNDLIEEAALPVILDSKEDDDLGCKSLNNRTVLLHRKASDHSQRQRSRSSSTSSRSSFSSTSSDNDDDTSSESSTKSEDEEEQDNKSNHPALSQNVQRSFGQLFSNFAKVVEQELQSYQQQNKNVDQQEDNNNTAKNQVSKDAFCSQPKRRPCIIRRKDISLHNRNNARSTLAPSASQSIRCSRGFHVVKRQKHHMPPLQNHNNNNNSSGSVIIVSSVLEAVVMPLLLRSEDTKKYKIYSFQTFLRYAVSQVTSGKITSKMEQQLYVEMVRMLGPNCLYNRFCTWVLDEMSHNHNVVNVAIYGLVYQEELLSDSITKLKELGAIFVDCWPKMLVEESNNNPFQWQHLFRDASPANKRNAYLIPSAFPWSHAMVSQRCGKYQQGAGCNIVLLTNPQTTNQQDILKHFLTVFGDLGFHLYDAQYPFEQATRTLLSAERDIRDTDFHNFARNLRQGTSLCWNSDRPKGSLSIFEHRFNDWRRKMYSKKLLLGQQQQKNWNMQVVVFNLDYVVDCDTIESLRKHGAYTIAQKDTFATTTCSVPIDFAFENTMSLLQCIQSCLEIY